ncbi:chemotaxis protein CheW [soil metagenome]
MDMINEGAHIAQNDALRAGAVTARAGEYLTYRLGDEEYGIDIQKVQEIRSYDAPTRIPNVPHFIKGVVNLRGVIVPILDLRLKLNCAEAAYTESTVVIVLGILGRVVGVVVDAVSDVLDLKAGDIKEPPGLAAESDPDFITGIASVGDRMLMLVNMESLLRDAALGYAQEPT